MASTKLPTVPQAARGQVALVIGGEGHTLRFGMNVMRDFTKLTGHAPSEFGSLLGENYPEALTSILTCAVRRQAGLPEFSQDDAGDLIDQLTEAENEALAEAITEAVQVGPLMAALMAKVTAKNAASAPTQPASGTPTSTSDSAS